ncbi:hypothetical protein K2173_026183 [Erythroxylum novogranatense]|uniref:BHLH domain-containing protein n=1 Tax=Erythroxylum novogranatense TaxID=1862640 RepID=A0AAV8T8Y6_9ROSI|nr:hypothetical protein K2173_026183 [Erythroxylum novogranatense]
METAVVAQMGKKRVKNGSSKKGQANKNGGDGVSEHGMHIWTERERRKKMRNMFCSLHALLPHLPAKADKSTIVDEAINYIRTLEESVQELEKQRAGKLQNEKITLDYESSSAITAQTQALESNTREAYLAAQGPSMSFPLAPNMTHPFPLFHPPACLVTWFSQNVVLSLCGDEAQISVCSLTKPGLLVTIFYILEKHNLDVVSAHISSDQYRSLYMIHARAARHADEIPEALSVEDTFKLAAGEMNLWLLSF